MSLPHGLTLLVGDDGAGKTVTATHLATTFAGKGQEVAYLTAWPWAGDRSKRLLDAQLNALSSMGGLAASGHIVRSSVRRTDIVSFANNLLSEGGEAQVIIVDSLPEPPQAFAWPSLRNLSFSARSQDVSVLATCSPEFLAAMKAAGHPLDSMAVSCLHAVSYGTSDDIHHLFAVSADTKKPAGPGVGLTLNEKTLRTKVNR
jgi:hypothetical protein